MNMRVCSVLTLYPEILLNLFISSNSFFQSLGLSIYTCPLQIVTILLLHFEQVIQFIQLGLSKLC